ncbi:MAG TPA: carboxypeptidase regulatory-like domain-containing protein [Pyrinomonadaceae bacterium]|nr:carboxypeptidase regulatory-like domain-containing protein [Pyrinomonadaceae bacterium]
MISKNKIALLGFVFLLLCSSVPVLGQTQTTGRIVGTITDEKGAGIPGAEVAVTNKTSGEERNVVSNESGDFIVPLLPAATYTVVVTSNGFKKFLADDVKVAITETTTLNALLNVGSVTESVTVVATPPIVQTENSQLGRVVDSRAVSELPLATRNFTQILSLSPGAATYLPDNTAVGRNSQNISVNGARVTNNNFQINGVDANSMGTNSAPSLSVPAPESIQEFKVQTSLYDATFGRSGGGNIQAVTKSGGNDFHGGAYEYFRNDKLNANNPYLIASGVARPILKRNIFGGFIGGPIKKDKAFFFASYQGTKERNGASTINSLSSNILVDPKLTNDRSATTLQTAYGLPAINPVALALLNAKLANGQFLIPTPTAANGTYTGSTPSIFKENQFNLNFDYRFNDRNTLATKFFFSNAPQTLVLPSFLGGGPNVPGYGNFQQNNNRLITMQYVHIFSPTVFNELRAGYNFIRVDAFPQEPVNDSAVGINRVNASIFPGLGLVQINAAAGGIVFGTSATIDVKAKAPSTTVADTLSITRGKHTIRTGGEYRYNENNYVLNFFTRGQIQFANFTNFLVGVPTFSVFGSGIGDRSLRATDYNVFVQDDWKVNRKLTLNLGLRYELDMPPYDTRGRIATFDPALYVPRPAIGGAVVGPPIGGYVQAGNVISQYDVASMPNVGKRVVNSVDPNDFAPRIGFAYSPLNSGRFVVRGGYGIFYSRTSFQYITLNVIAPPTYVFGVSILPPITNPFFAAPPTSAFPTLVPGVALSGTLFDRNIRTPYLHQFNVNAQYEVYKDFLLEVAYVGTRGRSLFRQVAINQAPLIPTGGSITNPVTGAVITTNTAANAALRSPFQGVSINGFFQNQTTAQSDYNALQVSLTKRFSNGIQFLASYTRAKSIDNASGQGGGAGITGVVNPGGVGETSAILGDQRDNRANRGLSDFDRKNRFVFSALYDLPTPGFAKSKGGKLLFGNWELAGIATVMSGLPIDIVDTGAGSFYGLSGGSAPLARPNLVGDPFSNVPAGYYFNPLAFARPVVAAGAVIPSSKGAATAGALGTDIGNVGRNLLRGPRQSNIDFSIIKRFRIAESKSIELRTEFFNLVNTVNFANPISDLNAVPAAGFNADGTIKPGGAGRFGQIISTSNNPRLIQLGIKFNF